MRRWLLAGMLLWGFIGSAAANEPVTLQLKWRHAFQFAGIYAAIEKGYYQAEGLDVRLREGGPGIKPLEAAERPASYAIADTGALIARAHGRKIRVIAAIFQHSPLVLVVLRSSGIRTFADLRGKRVMLQPGLNADIVAALGKAGLRKGDYVRQAISYDIRDLIAGRTDAYAAYITDQPHQLQKLGVAYRLLMPAEEGIDFYGDLLVTSDAEVREHPERVRAMIRATARGWDYALEHPHEIIDLILKKYDTRHLGPDQLQYEAEATARMIVKDLVPIGFMNDYRWANIARAYAGLGLIPADFDYHALLFRPGPSLIEVLNKYRWQLAAMALAMLLLGVASYVLTLRRMVRARTERLRMLSLATEQTDELVMVGDRKGMIEYANPAFCHKIGRPGGELSGAPVGEILTIEPDGDQTLERIWESVLSGKGWSGRVRLRHGEHPRYPALMSVSPLREPGGRGTVTHVVAVFRDMTEIENMKEQLLQAQKMEAIGVLVGGIAHDFNNMLAALYGNIELARLDADEPARTREWLEKMQTIASRGADTVAKLLAFARKGPVHFEVAALNEVLAEVERLTRIGLPERIELVFNVPSELVPVYMDATQIEQALLNLVNNAADAVEGVACPRIEVSARAVSGAAGPGAGRNAEHGWVELSVRDNGEGIAAEDLEHIFEPFFTTKEVGKGSGLGLAMVYGTVQRHGGEVQVESRPGQGACFRLWLPLAAPTATAESRSAEESEDVGGLAGRGECILVADDEDEPRETLRKLLERRGYRVVVAGNGKQTVEMFRKYRHELAAAVLDLVMPEKDGIEAAREIRDMEAEFPILFVSGYDLHKHGAAVADWPRTMLTPKPYRPEDLERKLRSLLQ